MNYNQTLEYLYAQLPMFQRIGAAAYKNDLGNTIALCKHFNNPQHNLKSVHVAGTNGKGSVSHMLAAILQKQGYKTGLYTSPHLVDFRERIKINGQMIPEEWIVSFVAQNKVFLEQLKPSFFEMTVALAFDYFAKEKVDFAVIETGMGGRLDSTNVITPLLSIITNISYDHKAFLGDTLPKIAAEKAGIIKPGVPVVIGERQEDIAFVFEEKAKQENSPLLFASQNYSAKALENKARNLKAEVSSPDGKSFVCNSSLSGNYQLKNLPTVFQSVEVLRSLGVVISDNALLEGIANAKQLTGLRGRWDVLQEEPLVVADIAHNEAGISEVVSQLKNFEYQKLHIVIGMVSDKEREAVFGLLPKNAIYYFCKPDIPRALDADTLANEASGAGLNGIAYGSVASAFATATASVTKNDCVLVTGSAFVVAETLSLHLSQQKMV